MTTDEIIEEDGLLIEPIIVSDDIRKGFNCLAEAFGRQTNDAMWVGLNAGWNTPEGKARCIENLSAAFRATTRDIYGNPNTLYLKATLPAAPTGEPVIVGMAIWVQASVVEGRGEAPSDDLRKSIDLEAMYPSNEPEQRFICQMYRSFVKRRLEAVKEKAKANPPCIVRLNTCAVDPAYQGRGIAKKLVQWGLDEAERRGIPEAITEASPMGRHVYARLGFHPEGPDLVYDVDSEFASRPLPPNVFMRRGGVNT